MKNEDKDLQKKLQEAKKSQEKKSKKPKSQDSNISQEDLNKVKQELEEQKEITKKAQYDYINLKMDFDRLLRQTQEKEEKMGEESLINSVKKFLPFVEDLRKSLENIPQEEKDDHIAKGVKLIYDKFLKTLETMNIKQIKAIGETPDSNLHEPVSMEPAPSKNQKGKIIKEFERGFYLESNGEKKVITTSKVIVGQ